MRNFVWIDEDDKTWTHWSILMMCLILWLKEKYPAPQEKEKKKLARKEKKKSDQAPRSINRRSTTQGKVLKDSRDLQSTKSRTWVILQDKWLGFNKFHIKRILTYRINGNVTFVSWLEQINFKTGNRFEQLNNKILDNFIHFSVYFVLMCGKKQKYLFYTGLYTLYKVNYMSKFWVRVFSFFFFF